ncbi:MAG TPA: hypothetical protein VGB83_00045 [Actinomycetota bacterium]
MSEHPTPVHGPERWPGGAEQQARSPRSGAFQIVAALLALALVLATVLAARLDQERRRSANLAAQLEYEQDAAAELRRTLEGDAPTALEGVQRAVERIRGLSPRDEVDITFLTREQLASRILALFERDTTEEDFEASQRILIALGVVPPDFDLREALLRVQQEEVVGFYDTTDRSLVVASEEAADPSPLDRVVFAHEYTHALTHQRFGLGRLDALENSQGDAALAFKALAEGDATLLMQQYTVQGLSTAEQLSLLEQPDTGASDSLPAFVRDELFFPYREGLAFVRALHERGGFDAVDDAYRDPPVSTEQVLHPERYFERDDPRRVRLPNVGDALGRGWRTLEGGQFGELDLRAMADEPAASTGLTSQEAERAAAGWDGGSYVGLASGDDVVVAVATVWDSAGEAAEAVELLGSWLPLRYRNLGERFEVTGGEGWDAPDGAGLVALAGERVVLVFAPTPALAERALGAFR